MTSDHPSANAADAALIARILPKVEAGAEEWRFVISPFVPGPSWRSDLNMFAVFRFEDGEPVDPDGSEERPFHFAVNSRMSGRVQVKTVANAVLSTLRRQQRTAAVTAGQERLEDLPADIQAIEAASQIESGSLEALLLAGDIAAAANLLSQYGRSIRFGWAPAWITSQEEFASRLPFLARAYNDVPEAREAIDRIVSATVGGGGRMSSTSEQVRQAAERMHIQGMVWRFFSHAVRDAELAGLGAAVLTMNGLTPRIRLIHPARMRIPIEGIGVEARDDPNGSWHRVDEALVIKGAEQEGHWPLSVLEPVIPSLRSIFVMQEVVARVDSVAASGHPKAGELTPQRVVASRMIADSSTSLRQILDPVLGELPESRPGLYFRGCETWSPL